MKVKYVIQYIAVAMILLPTWGCKIFKAPLRTENKATPATYNNAHDTANIAQLKWRSYFTDSNLVALIDTALNHNQELNVVLQEIEVARNEVKAKKGEYLPSVGITAGAGVDKVGKFTRNGAVEENLEIKPGKKFPEPLGDFVIGAVFSWELDVWKKLRNSKKAAAARYLATVEGKNFMVTNLIAEMANTYYELLAFDNQLQIINRNIELQQNALRIVKLQKDAAKVSQLAVNRFEAQLLNTQNLQYEVQQQIVETTNHLNFLAGRYPTDISRDANAFNRTIFDSVAIGIPSQLLENRPDIRKAEQELIAAKLDVKVAKANFFPNFKLSASAGFQAFNPAVWFHPESILYNVIGDLMMPLINRNAIKAAYMSSRAKQVQAVVQYEQTILKAYVEVVNQLSGIDNYQKSFEAKANETEILSQSVAIADNLFKSARADYMEVLLTQREALDAKMELIEIKKKQLVKEVNIYKALGGGWN